MRSAIVIGTAMLAAALALAGCGTSGQGPSSESRGAPRPDVDPYLPMTTVLVAHSCSNCHAADYARVGPSMKDVATVLGDGSQQAARARLRDSILNGSKGKWGEAIMPAQHQVAPDQVDAIIDTILSMNKPR